MNAGLPKSLVRTMLCLVVVAVVAVVAAACGRSAATATPSPPATAPAPTPAVDGGATPPGWVPIVFDDAQISVPVHWITATADCPFGSAPGMVIVRDVASLTGCVLETGPAISDVVSITPESPPLLAPEGKRTSINGITVDWGRPTGNSIGYQVPSLGVQIDARGVLGPDVLDTLTRSRAR
ncbi:MAG TPA: hypothetical protein VN820_04760 [Acidimicrobiales bacterium]|nr:hypothetical protein [Acidimicrobiales bacterium]